MQQSFFNTIPLPEPELTESTRNAKAQEKLCLEVYELGAPITCEECHELLVRRKKISATVPLTSVRRAVSNLKRDGKIIATGILKPGSMGKPINQYKIKVVDSCKVENS